MPKRITGRYDRTTVGGEEIAAFEGLTATWDYHFLGEPWDLTVDEGYFS